MTPKPVKVAVVAQTAAISNLLAEFIKAPHSATVLNYQQAIQAIESDRFDFDACVLGVDEHSSGSLLESLDTIQVSVLVMDQLMPLQGSSAHRQWLKASATKIGQFIGRLCYQNDVAENAEKVVIIGASMGGPDSIRAFFSELRPTDGVAFVYAQHIASQFHTVLEQMVQNSSSYEAIVIDTGMQIKAGNVYIVPADVETSLGEDGRFTVDETTWRGDYAPSIDQIIMTVARHYKDRSVALIFSGMGDDAVKGARYMIEMGYDVLAETAESCQADSMPEAVAEVSNRVIRATPKQMAYHVLQFSKNKASMR